MEALGADLRDAIEDLADVPLLLVAIDFDGTMAPIVDRPEEARPLPAAARALAELAGLENTVTALVSGRHLDGLRAVAAPPPEVLLVGSHGAERWAPGKYDADVTEVALEPAEAKLLEQVRERLGRVAAACPGASLEAKPAAVVLHVRQAEEDAGAAALEAGRDALEELADPDRPIRATLTDGKAVLEASVLQADKGSALDWLREVADASRVLYAGDDVTDEHAFAALRPGDIGVKVGSGPTRAQFRVEGPGEIPGLLQAILDVRS